MRSALQNSAIVLTVAATAATAGSRIVGPTTAAPDIGAVMVSGGGRSSTSTVSARRGAGGHATSPTMAWTVHWYWPDAIDTRSTGSALSTRRCTSPELITTR